MIDQPPSTEKGHNLHDEFFKQTFKSPKWLLELLQVIFPAELTDAFAAGSLTIRDGLLHKLGKGEMRTDLTASVRLKDSDIEVTITFILEHKSYRDPQAILQTMEYYLRARREQLQQRSRQKNAPRNLIIPAVLLCCADEHFTLPRDDLQLEFGSYEKVPQVLKDVRALLPQLSCLVVNLRRLNLDALEGRAACAVTALRVMVGVWGADDETIALLIAKIRQLLPEDGAHLWSRLMDYYDASDNKVVREDFNRVDRERWPHLDEKERVENVFEFSVDRAERLGMEN